jgi:hypothetical protein
MGDIREFYLATAILVIGGLVSFGIVQYVPVIRDLHPLVRIGFVLGGGLAFFFGVILLWAALARVFGKNKDQR